MLILTRRVGETLMIGDEVSVTVLGVKGNQVRLGVNAPKDIAVHREEIYQRILHEKTGQDAGYTGDNSRYGYGNFDNARHLDASHSYPAERHYATERSYSTERNYDEQGGERPERIGLNAERRYPRVIQRGQAHAPHSGFGSERVASGGMNHLENRNFDESLDKQGFDKNSKFNPSFDPFDEDYYNR